MPEQGRPGFGKLVLAIVCGILIANLLSWAVISACKAFFLF